MKSMTRSKGKTMNIETKQTNQKPNIVSHIQREERRGEGRRGEKERRGERRHTAI